jgi:hypothetical protein
MNDKLDFDPAKLKLDAKFLAELELRDVDEGGNQLHFAFRGDAPKPEYPKFTAELLQARCKGDTARQKRRKKPAPHEFVKLPMLWAQCLIDNRAGVNAYRVALYVLHEAWRTNNPKVKLTNAVLAANGVRRKGKATALRQLRKAGLISVEERPNKSPIVTVRFLEQ